MHTVHYSTLLYIIHDIYRERPQGVSRRDIVRLTAKYITLLYFNYCHAQCLDGHRYP